MKKSSNLIFFGNERLSTGFKPMGAPTLEALLRAGYTVSAVVANYERGTSRSARHLEIETVARKHNIPLLLPTKLADIHDQLAVLQPKFGILVAYGKIIPQSVIDLFPRGIINIHPSLLPLYRGSTPIEQAMLDGASQAGVSIMKIVKAMDAGPIYIQQAVKLSGNEQKQALTQHLLDLGGQLLLKVLPRILEDTIAPIAQDESKATYTTQIKKQDGQLDWQKSAEQLEREIRAYAGWPKSRTILFGHPVVVVKVHVVSNISEAALVQHCNPGFLAIDQLIAPSGKLMDATAFLRGYQK